MRTKLILSGLAFIAITTLAGAQNNGVPGRHKNCPGNCTAYVDANKNGICDNYENVTPASAIPKKSGNGSGCRMGKKQQSMGQGRRINFVDANKNGICDYYEVETKK